MKKQDLLSILITFLVGVLAGAYLFLVGFAPTLVKFQVPSQEKIAGLTIEGELYGGCHDACPSFQLLSDGSYRYLHYTDDNQPPLMQSGRVPNSLQRELARRLIPVALAEQARSLVPRDCNSYTDGVDVHYTITLAGEKYLLDSCTTQVEVNSALWSSLRSVWNHLQISD